MTIYRYKKNGLLYTISANGHGSNYKVYPYKHVTEIGVVFSSNKRFRDFKSDMTMDDFEPVAEC